jgi:aminocarboxymuconate-semialdehyde decarboxylase
MSFTIDVHHHILPEVFWRATNDAHNPVGGITWAARRKAEFVFEC